MPAARSFASLAIGLFLLGSCGSDDGPRATLESPTDGRTIAGGVPLRMAAEGIEIEEAGEARDGAGHFHVIAGDGCAATGETIGKDADHVHFGKAQTEGTIYLEPGTHELCLQVGDGLHAALAVTDTATITVGIDDQQAWCAVVGEVDDMFEAVDTSSDDFATKRLGYENIRRLVAQLSDGIEAVDVDARDDVAAAIDFAAAIASAFTSSATLEEAERALEPIFESIGDGLPGGDWILDTCDVDVNG